MKKLSVSLKESRFVDLINKKFTGEIRKEDMIGNLQKLKPVDIGTSVLWADDDLCVDDKYLFTFDDVTNMLKDSKWRLPTVSEVEELKSKLENKYNKHIIVKTEIDKSLLGGVYVRVGNDVIDGTVKSKLDEMKDIILKK